MQPLYITYNRQQGWWTITYFNGEQHNFASLATLLGAISDHYEPSEKK